MPDPREAHLQEIHNAHLGLLSIHSAFNTIFTRLIPTEQKQKTCGQKVSSLLKWAEIKGENAGEEADNSNDRAFARIEEDPEVRDSQPEPEPHRRASSDEEQPQPQTRRPAKRTRRNTSSSSKEVKREGKRRKSSAKEEPLKPGETKVLVFRPVVSYYPARGPLLLDDLTLACSIARAKGMHERFARKNNRRSFLERNVVSGKQWLKANASNR